MQTIHLRRGFTLIELLMVVVIAIIMAAIGVPSFMGLIKSNRLTAGVNDTIGSIQLARSEASKRGRAITICPSADINAEEPDCSSSAGWQDGRIGFVDDNGDGSRSSSEELVFVHSSLDTTIFVQASSPVEGGLTYGGDGFPTGLAADDSVLVFCDAADADGDSRARILSISSTGRPAVLKDASPPSGLACSDP